MLNLSVAARNVGIVVLAVGLVACAGRRKAIEANNRAFGLLAQKRYADAIKEFDRGIALDPKVPELYLGLGRCYEETQRYQLAEKNFQKYTKLRGKDPDGHYYLGLVLEAQKRDREAAAAYRAAAALPNEGRKHLAYYRLGRALIRMGKLNDAATAFRESAHADPTFLRAYDELALLYADNGDLASAEKALRNAIETQIKDAHISSSLGIVYSKMADRVRDESARNNLLEKAAENFRKATAIKPSYARAYWNLGMTLAKIMKGGRPSRRAEAMKFLQLFLSRHGKDDELSSKANDMITHLASLGRSGR